MRQDLEIQRQAEQEAIRTQNEARAKAQALERRGGILEFEVIQITSEGVLAHARPANFAGSPGVYTDELFFVEMDAPREFDRRQRVHRRAYGAGTFTYKTVLGARSKIRKLKVLAA